MYFASDYVLAENYTKRLPDTDDREPEVHPTS